MVVEALPPALPRADSNTARVRLRAGLLVLVVVLVELWPALVGGRLLLATSFLYEYAPWHNYAPADLGHYFNPLLSDFPLAYYPWASLARNLIHQGTFPAWNPYAFAGTPFFANPQLAWFSPFSLPMWILPLNYAFGVAAALKLWLAGFGTYLLARELRLGFWPGVIAAVSFTLCASNVVWMSPGVLLSVTALLPWMLWLTERIVRRGRMWDGIALAFASAFAFSGGQPAAEVHVASAVAIYAFVRVVAIGELGRRDRVRRLAIAGTGCALGALLLSVTLVPTLAEVPGTAGELARRNGGAMLPNTTMPISVAKTILFPDWWGRPSAIDLGGPANYNDRTLYAGAVAVLLASVALVTSSAWRRKAPLAVLAALALAAPLGIQPVRWFLTHVPPFDSVENQRMIFLFMLAAAVLAGFGVEALLERQRPTPRAWGVLAAGLLAGLIAFLLIAPSAHDVGQTISHFATGADYASASVIEITSVGWWTLLTIGVALVVVVHWRWKRVASYAPALLALLAAFDMLRFAHGYQPMGPSSKVIPPRTPAVSYLQRHAADGRVVGFQARTGPLRFAARAEGPLAGAEVWDTLINDWTTVYGLRDVRGYDPPQPSVRFARFWRRLVSPSQIAWTSYHTDTVSEPALRFLSVLGARYLVLGPGEGLAPNRTGSFGHLSLAYSGPDATILENADALPRAMVAPSVQIVDGEQGILGALTNVGFDPRREVLLERGEAGVAGLTATVGRDGTAAVVHDGNSQVRLRASLLRPGVVVLDDQLASGWTVRVDGRPAPALRVDGLMRGVVVPAGTHSVVWNYAVPGLRLGLILSGLGFLGVLVWMLIARIGSAAASTEAAETNRPRIPSGARQLVGPPRVDSS